MNQRDFIHQLNGVLPDGTGFWCDQIVPLNDLRLAADGDVIGTGTAPTMTTTGVSWDGTETAHLWVHIPGDYDQEADQLHLRITCSVASATDQMSFDVTACQRFRDDGPAAGTAVTMTVNADTTEVAASLVDVLDLDLDGHSFQANDVCRFTLLATEVTGTTECIVHKMMVRYKSDLVLYNETQRHAAG